MEIRSETHDISCNRDRIRLHVSREQREILAQAAATSGIGVGAFVLSRAMESARELIVDHTVCGVTAERWAAFLTMLDADRGQRHVPARYRPLRTVLDE